MKPSAGRILLIANPAAGRGRVHEALPEIQAACRSMGIEYDLRYTFVVLAFCKTLPRTEDEI